MPCKLLDIGASFLSDYRAHGSCFVWLAAMLLTCMLPFGMRQTRPMLDVLARCVGLCVGVSLGVGW